MEENRKRYNRDMCHATDHRRCWFDLKTGETIVGTVKKVHYNEEIIEIAATHPEEKTIVISCNSVYRYEAISNGRSRRSQINLNALYDHPGYLEDHKKTKKLIIFGAGASADLIPSSMGEIPMTNGLFDDLEKLHFYPGAQKLRQKVLTFIRTGKSLEEFFEEKWQEYLLSGDDEQLSRLINTQYYLHSLFSEISIQHYNQDGTNYNLISEILRQYLKIKQDENIAVVSFNYDTLLENSLNHIFDFEFNSHYDYVFEKRNGNNYRKKIMLFKPHGSWNWIFKLNDEFISNAIGVKSEIFGDPEMSVSTVFYEKKINYAQLKIAIAPELLNSEISLESIPKHVIDNFEVASFSSQYQSSFYYPNMLIPFKSKDSMLLHEFQESYFISCLEQVEEIFIVGWKGTEHHFNSILKQNLQGRKIKITYVSPNSKTVEEELSKYLPDAEFERIQSSFSNFLKDFKSKEAIPYNPFRVEEY